MEIVYSSKFVKHYKKLSSDLKNIVEEKEELFKKDPFDRKLKTHKLHGRFSKYYAFSISNSDRIMFEFWNNKVIFVNIGNHEIHNY